MIRSRVGMLISRGHLEESDPSGELIVSSCEIVGEFRSGSQEDVAFGCAFGSLRGARRAGQDARGDFLRPG